VRLFPTAARGNKNKNKALMVMQHLYSYMRRGNESWTWQLSPQDVHWYNLRGGREKK